MVVDEGVTMVGKEEEQTSVGGEREEKSEDLK